MTTPADFARMGLLLDACADVLIDHLLIDRDQALRLIWQATCKRYGVDPATLPDPIDVEA